jgi:hypothetical protein
MRRTYMPIGGVARFERIPESRVRSFSSPLQVRWSMWESRSLMALTLRHLSAEHFAAMESLKVSMIDRLADINLFLAVFNMVPAWSRFPDGRGPGISGAAGNPARRPGYRNRRYDRQWTAFLLGFLELFYSPLLIFIAIFVYLAAAAETQMVSLRAMSRDVPVTAAMVTQLATLTGGENIDTAVKALLQTSQTEFPVVDKNRRLPASSAAPKSSERFGNSGPRPGSPTSR